MKKALMTTASTSAMPSSRSISCQTGRWRRRSPAAASSGSSSGVATDDDPVPASPSSWSVGRVTGRA